MRKLSSYTRKYGPVAGPIILRLLQSQAAHARLAAYWRGRALAAESPKNIG